MKPWLPPKDIAPERLFRMMLRLAPIEPLDYRLAGPDAEDIALSVRPLHGVEERAAADVAAAVENEETRRSVYLRNLIALALLADGEQAFLDAAEVGALSGDEVAALGGSVLTALSRFAPTYGASDVTAWVDVLQRGARHPSNIHEAHVLASCVSDGQHWIIARPDRYWGVPLKDLLDHHWMVFRAARNATEETSVDPRRAAAAARRLQGR